MQDLSRIERDFFPENYPVSTQTDYPFKLIGRRHIRSNNSWMHNSYRLVKGKNRCTLLMHPLDADRLGLQTQQIVEVSSMQGQLSLPIEISEEIMPGVVSIPHGWGHHSAAISGAVAKQHAGVNMNELIKNTIDPLSGVAVLNGTSVQISAANLAVQSSI